MTANPTKLQLVVKQEFPEEVPITAPVSKMLLLQRRCRPLLLSNCLQDENSCKVDFGLSPCELFLGALCLRAWFLRALERPHFARLIVSTHSVRAQIASASRFGQRLLPVLNSLPILPSP